MAEKSIGTEQGAQGSRAGRATTRHASPKRPVDAERYTRFGYLLDGRSYNPAKTRRVCAARGEDGTETSLHLKRTGEYFLAECPEGGDYGAITPLTYEAAEAWARANATPEEADAEFGRIADAADVPDVTMCVRISKAAKDVIDRHVAKNGGTRGEALTKLIMERL